MNLLQKIKLKIEIEKKFLTEQKWAISKPSDPYSIPKNSLKKYLPSDPIIIDCGAHVGADSIELARIFPRSSVFSFEPVPEIFHQLKKNTRKFKNISCYQLALSDATGSATMHVSSGRSDASSSLLQPTGHKEDHPDVFFEKNIHVNTITLDDWAQKNNIQKIDFLWLDMQGFEFQMLNASSKIFPHIKAIHMEVSLREAYSQSMLYPDLKKWMNERGFDVITEAVPEGTDMGNALFVKIK
jgi:FkbM family methyltransferase